MTSDGCTACERDSLGELHDIIHDISHYLPSQGPIKTFVHHNTLHQFEGREFFDGIDSAADLYGAQSALPESTYQDLFGQGRIRYSDLNRALGEYGIKGDTWLLGLSKRKVARSLLLSAPVLLTAETLRWRLLEKHYLQRFHEEVTPAKVKHIRASDAATPQEQLQRWLASYEEVVREWNQPWLYELIETAELSRISPSDWTTQDSLKLLWIAAIVYSRSVLLADPSHGSDHHPQTSTAPIEELINPYLIKFTSTFLDRGLAHLTQSDRAHGLLEAFFSHMQNRSFGRPAWLRGDLSRYEKLGALELIGSILREKGVSPTETKAFLLQKALILKGWAGLVYQSERGVAGISNRASVAEFLAVRLVMESLAEAYFEKRPHLLGVEEPESPFELHRPGVADVHDEAARIRTTAYHLFHAFQLFPCSGSELLGLEPQQKQALVELFCQFDSPLRLRVWHKAYEWNLYSRTASALVHHNKKAAEKKQQRESLCQIVTCIDDREESFRRYIEEISSDYETFGTAGFFGVDAEFHSLYERPAAFCPVNVVPTHQIQIRPKEGAENRLIGLQRIRTLRSDVDMFIESQSRSLVRGWLLALGGLLALFPLSLSTLAPRLVHRFNLFLKKTLINPTDESAIVFADEGDSATDGLFTLDEMVHRVKTLLVSTGLSKRLAPLVVIMGHGSFSTNNPFRSAYDCGACGGRPGRMNSRVFAMMANRKDVREKLREQGFVIPNTTTFIGAFHNTCTDEVEYFDLDQLVDANAKIFERLRSDVDVARAQNALERCRRFDDTSVHTVQEAIAHVESRAHHIAQPRPEYGHATNALCFVGRRDLTKGLFLDRRAFLVSYDKDVDGDCSALKNLLRAVVPVCMGINLEYFFSALDNQKYGAGTKLPHNVTSLLGLMTGYCSDLRTGLPAQMVEIHEPVRLLFVLEQEPEKVLDIMSKEPDIDRVIRNHWVKVMTYSQAENKLHYFDHTGSFVPFEELTVEIGAVSSSLSWVLGKKGHLDFVRVG